MRKSHKPGRPQRCKKGRFKRVRRDVQAHSNKPTRRYFYMEEEEKVKERDSNKKGVYVAPSLTTEKLFDSVAPTVLGSGYIYPSFPNIEFWLEPAKNDSETAHK